MKFPFTKELILVGIFAPIFAAPAAFGSYGKQPFGKDKTCQVQVSVNNYVPSIKVIVTPGADEDGRGTLTIDIRDAFDPPPAMGGAG